MANSLLILDPARMRSCNPIHYKFPFHLNMMCACHYLRKMYVQFFHISCFCPRIFGGSAILLGSVHGKYVYDILKTLMLFFFYEVYVVFFTLERGTMNRNSLWQLQSLQTKNKNHFLSKWRPCIKKRGQKKLITYSVTQAYTGRKFRMIFVI